MSKKTILLTFTGRTSGRTYTTPVAYVRIGDGLGITTDSRWGNNLRGGAPVTVRLQGQTRNGTATVLDDEREAADVLAALIRSQPSYGKHADVTVDADGTFNDDDVLAAVRKGRL